MVIDFDHNPNIDTDHKLQSLKESTQMALDELTVAIESLRKEIKEIESSLGA